MKKKSSFQPCSSLVLCIDFLSSFSESIVYGDLDGNIFLFSTKTCNIVWTNINSSGYAVQSVAVSPNDDIVAFGESKGLLHVINAINGESFCSVDVGSSIWSVLFLSHQNIVCGLQNGKVAIVCWKTQKIEKILDIYDFSVYALAISPVNNDILLTGHYLGLIGQTIISSEQTVMAYEGHTEFVKDLSFLSCGTMFVSGSGDRTVRLFALDQKKASFSVCQSSMQQS